jgi:hypothetical protein
MEWVYEKTTDFREPRDEDYLLLAKNGLFFVTKSLLATSSEIVFAPVNKRGLSWLESHKQDSGGFWKNIFSFQKKITDKTETDKTKKRGGIKMFELYHKTKGFKPPDDQIYYLLGKNDLFLIKKTPFFTSSIPIFSSVGNRGLGWLEPHTASIKLNLPKKISLEDIRMITEFFRKIWLKYKGSEAIVFIYWDEKAQKYVFRVPEQQAGGQVHYKVGKNPEGLIRFGDVHSHGAGDAGHSEKDDTDEEHDDGVHITIGNVDFNPSIACSVVSDGMRASFKPESIIEIDTIDIPEEWIDKVKNYAPPVATVGFPYGSAVKYPGGKAFKGVR